MIGKTHKIGRIATGVALAVSIAALAVPTALAGKTSNDTGVVASQLLGSPDPHDAALQSQSSGGGIVASQTLGSPDPRATALQSQSSGGGQTGIVASQTLGSPDPHDTALQSQSSGGQTGAVASQLLGSPDPHDAALRTADGPRLVLASPDGFDWGDAGIGAAAGLAIALILGGVLVVTRSDRRQLAH